MILNPDFRSGLTADMLADVLVGGGEIAVIDVREAVDARRTGTLLVALAIPLGSLELRLGSLVPRRDTPVVVIDDTGADDGLAARAVRRLGELGYPRATRLTGGVAAWEEAGLQLYPGGYAMGQAFGEFVEATFDTPHISATEVASRIAAGENIVLLDSRSPAEFQAQSIPGAINCPGPELAYRIDGLVPDDDALVVINCAGRTRSIMGAQTLIDAGVANRVVALENGTMGWRLAGLELDHGASRSAPGPDREQLDRASGRALELQRTLGIERIDHDRLDALRAEADRSLFVLDVRDVADYLAGHIPGAVSAPSWELVPWAFNFVGTRGARIVLVDDADAVRSTASAVWLRRMGWDDVYLLPAPGGANAPGPSPTVLLDPPHDIARLSAAGMAAHVEKGGVLIDLSPSFVHREAHPAGAVWALRSRLDEARAALPPGSVVAFTAQDERLAAYAARDAAGQPGWQIAGVLDGGNAAWVAAGLPLASGDAGFLHEAVDQYSSPWLNGEDDFASFRQYLSWEVALQAQVARDVTAPYQPFGAEARLLGAAI